MVEVRHAEEDEDLDVVVDENACEIDEKVFKKPAHVPEFKDKDSKEAKAYVSTLKA